MLHFITNAEAHTALLVSITANLAILWRMHRKLNGHMSKRKDAAHSDHAEEQDR